MPMRVKCLIGVFDGCKSDAADLTLNGLATTEISEFTGQKLSRMVIISGAFAGARSNRRQRPEFYSCPSCNLRESDFFGEGAGMQVVLRVDFKYCSFECNNKVWLWHAFFDFG
jgi:hypothetical protein